MCRLYYTVTFFNDIKESWKCCELRLRITSLIGGIQWGRSPSFGFPEVDMYAQSDIHCNCSATSPSCSATEKIALRDWQFSPVAEVATRSPIGPGEVAEKSATSQGPRCDQTSQNMLKKPGCDWFGRRQVPAKSPTSLNLEHLNSSKMTSVTFGMISTISVTSLKNSSLINEKKKFVTISKIEHMLMQVSGEIVPKRNRTQIEWVRFLWRNRTLGTI